MNFFWWPIMSHQLLPALRNLTMNFRNLAVYVRLCNFINLWTNLCNLDCLRVIKCVSVITGHYR